MTPERHRRGPLVGEDRLLRLPDGRTVSCWEGGDPAGSPVLFHSGTPSGRLQATLGHEAARRAGVRLLSFNRPGYGVSSDLPPGLAQVGRDALDVLDQYDVDRFAVLGISGGGPYALATGLADQTRVTAVGSRGRRRAVDADRRPGPRRLGTPPAGAGRGRRPGRARAGFAAPRGRGVRLALTRSLRRGGRQRVLRRRTARRDRVAGSDVPPPVGGGHAGRPRPLRRVRPRQPVLGHDVGPRPRPAPGAVPGSGTAPRTGWSPPSHGLWLRDHLPDARLEIIPGEGHGAVIFPRLTEIFTALTS